MQVIVGAGLLGGLSLGFLKMNEMQTQSVAHFSSRTEANETFRRAITLLSDYQVCTESITNHDIGADDFVIYSSDGSGVLLESGMVINNMIEITSMRTEEHIIPESLPGWGHLKFFLETKRLGQGDRGRTISRESTIRVRYDDSGEVVSCHGLDESVVITSLSEMCALLGGEYSDSPESCELQAECDEEKSDKVSSLYCLHEIKREVDVRGQSCPPGQFVTGVSSGGELNCGSPPSD